MGIITPRCEHIYAFYPNSTFKLGFWDQLLRGHQHVGIIAQGFQRQLGPGGRVEPLAVPSAHLLVR